MNSLLSALLALVKYLGKVLLLPFSNSHSPSTLQMCVRWGLHCCCVLALLFGAYFLNHSLHLDSWLLTPIPALRHWWLPVLFSQLYVISWLAWWLVRTLTKSQPLTQHADLQQAWQRVQVGLTVEGIDPHQRPVFLIVGRPLGGTDTFFKSAQLVVREVGQSNTTPAPFQLFASDDALFLSCEDCCLLGLQSQLMYRSEQVQRDTATRSRAIKHGPSVPAVFATELVATELIPTDMIMEQRSDNCTFSDWTADASQPWDVPVRNGSTAAGSTAAGSMTSTSVAVAQSRPATPLDSMQLIEENIALLADEPRTQSQPTTAGERYQPTRQFSVPLLTDATTVAEATSRLESLCQLLGMLRAPFCPLNGIVVLIPMSSTHDQDIANHVGMLIESDLRTIAESTQVDAPRIAVLCDLQQITGCREMLERFPSMQRHRRLGVKFPRLTSCDRPLMHSLIQQGTSWLCERLIPPIVNRLMFAEVAGSGSGSFPAENESLFRFVCEMRNRKQQMERLLRRGFHGDSQPPELLRGCYLAATGRHATQEHGFAAGIISQVAEMQDEVQWNQTARQQDRDYHRLTFFGYASLLSVVLAAVIAYCL